MTLFPLGCAELGYPFIESMAGFTRPTRLQSTPRLPSRFLVCQCLIWGFHKKIVVLLRAFWSSCFRFVSLLWLSHLFSPSFLCWNRSSLGGGVRAQKFVSHLSNMFVAVISRLSVRLCSMSRNYWIPDFARAHRYFRSFVSVFGSQESIPKYPTQPLKKFIRRLDNVGLQLLEVDLPFPVFCD